MLGRWNPSVPGGVVWFLQFRKIKLVLVEEALKKFHISS